jgi:rSAM/selenodomain-associated transferase 2
MPYNPRAEMKDEKLLTVVIPTLDEERTIGACLDSVGEDRRLAVVVSDGGSRDDTLRIVDRYPNTQRVRGAAGRGQQLNRGAAAAGSSLLLFLHADCRLPAGWFEPVEEALADPGTALSCFRLHTEPSSGGSAGGWRRGWLRLLDLRSRGFGLPYGDQGFGLRRDTFERVGGFPDIPLMEDVAMARACRRLGRIRRLPLEIRTSARRFERYPVRTRLMTVTFPLLFRFGVSPWRLASWYRLVR